MAAGPAELLRHSTATETATGLFAGDHPHSWLVLHVKSRQEKALSLDLSCRGVEYYLPLAVERRMRAGRVMNIESPLFPGYVFLRGSLEDAYYADRTRRVAQIIRVADQTALNAELASVHLALSAGAPLLQHKWLRCGVRVQVVAGPLQGLQGLVEDLRSFDCVILQVNMLGRAMSVEVDPGCVLALD